MVTGSIHKPERRPSFPEDEDEEELLVGGVSFQKLEEGGELCELEYDMMGDMEDHLEYEMIDNITSCNVVDNYLMLDEYEQNLCKVGVCSINQRASSITNISIHYFLSSHQINAHSNFTVRLKGFTKNKIAQRSDIHF